MAKRPKRTAPSARQKRGQQGATDPDTSPPSEIGSPTADGPYPYANKLKTKLYEQQLLQLQIELLKMQSWTKATGQKIAILFEGRDAAGKGGTIKRFTQHLNPRGSRVVALEKPNEAERGQWYFQRYVAHLPTQGEIVFFDRSWYNRAGVEPIMGFCTPEQYQRFVHQAPAFESSLIEAGIRLFKLWFDVSRKEQRRRIESRRTDPLKRWKLSPMDAKAMARWDGYTEARDDMFLYTDTKDAPWLVIRSDDKKRARLGAILAVLGQLPYPEKDTKVATRPDPLIVGPARQMVPMSGRMMFAERD